MAGKAQPIKFRLYYKGEQVEKLPPEALQGQAERLSAAFSRYCSQHPEALQSLVGKDYAEVIFYDAAGNPK